MKHISISSNSVLSNSSNSSNSVLYKYSFCLHTVKCQNSSIWTIQFSVSTISISKTVLLQVIQFSISIHFSSTWFIDRALIRCYHSAAMQAWEQWQWRGTMHSPNLQHYWNLIIRLFSVISMTLVGWGGLTPFQRCSRCIQQPQPTGQPKICLDIYIYIYMCVCVCVCVCVCIIFTFKHV